MGTRRVTRQRGLIVAATLAVFVSGGGESPTAAQALSSALPAPADAPLDADFVAFHRAVEQYLTVQRRLRNELPPPTVTTDTRRIAQVSDVLALAIQRVRPKPSQGDMFDSRTRKAIVERLRRVLEGVDAVQLVADINDEPAFKGPPRVYMRFPVSTSMATMPTNLIEQLPPVPKELEYRFVGRYLILRDVDAALIIDYMSGALPAR